MPTSHFPEAEVCPGGGDPSAHIDISSSVVMKPFAKDYANLPLIVHSLTHTHPLTTHTLAWRAFIYIYIQLAEDLRIIIYAPPAPHTSSSSKETASWGHRVRVREESWQERHFIQNASKIAHSYDRPGEL